MSAFSKKNWGLKLSLMCRHLARLLLHIGKYTWLTASLIQDHAEPAPTFFTWSNITRILNYKMLPASLPHVNISDVGFFKEKLRSQTFFEVPPDCYCKSVNTPWRTASPIQDHAEPAPTFLLNTNITPISNYKMQPASSLTFSHVQLYSTCDWGGWQK